MTDEARLTRIAAALALERASPLRIEHTVQVTSFGGVGSTAFSNHLVAHGVDLPQTPGEFPFKHQRIPPSIDEVPDGFRAIYLFGDPRNAVLSILQRGLGAGHYRALNRTAPTARELAALRNVDAFISDGRDHFKIADHATRWMEHELAFPILSVRYEALSDPEVWREVERFVGTPIGSFELRPRTSDWTALPSVQREGFEALYGELAEKLARCPDVLTVLT